MQYTHISSDSKSLTGTMADISYNPDALALVKDIRRGNGNLKLKEPEFNKQSNSYIDKVKDSIYNVYNTIMNNKANLVLGITTILVSILFYRKSKQFDKLENSYKEFKKNQKQLIKAPYEYAS